MNFHKNFKEKVIESLALNQQAIVRLGNGMNDLRNKVDEIRENHITHLQEEIVSIKLNMDKKPSWATLVLITLLSSTVVGLVTGIAIWMLRNS